MPWQRLAHLCIVCLIAWGSTPIVCADPLEGWLDTLNWRCIGPSRGGRVSSVCGVHGDLRTYYMGATGGGVWKTEDAGVSWRNVSDGFFGAGSVGAVAVAPSDPNVVYAGLGEPDIRGNFSHGDGVYRSQDAGKTWQHMGLEDSRQIGRIVVHPTKPDRVYVAAMGHVFGPNAERGVYRSDDGGENWRRVLYVDDRSGAVDVAIDPNNPRVLFAGIWQTARTPWSLESGGPGSGLYRSQDGGESWHELTEGLPEGLKGKIGVSVSAAQRDRVWAIIEADDGGLFRSDDGGESWQRVSEDRSLRQRAWYYSRVHADPQHPDTVYVMNVAFHKSIDGGRTFSRIRVPHPDNHDLWIDPADNQRMINGNDGGANISFNGGRTWSRQDNQPTAQFYRVATDNNFPYRVLGAQQDNSTVSISSQTRLGWREDHHAVGGGESGYIAARPDDPDIIFAGSYGGYMTRYDHRTGKRRNITVWPDNPMGSGADALVHRFQWTFPIIISQHDHDVLYVGGEVLFRSEDQGGSWDIISPDLTTNDKSKQASSGGPITKDNTSVEYYCTIFTVAESPHDADTLWVGTDDGLVHVTSDGGENWSNVTPAGMGDWPLISMIEASTHDPDTAYMAVTRYKMDDFRPYVYRTRDRGETWTLIADGIGDQAFVRSVREDPVRAGLLYAATELGVWFSMDDGANWHSLQLELPVTPVTDVVVKDNDLVIATQGRSFWILEDLTILRQLADLEQRQSPRLFTPDVVYRQRWDRLRAHFFVPEGQEETLTIDIVGGDSEAPIRSYLVRVEDQNDDREPEDDQDTFDATTGMNRLQWNLRHPSSSRVPGAVGWPGPPPGPRVMPGEYTVRLTIGNEQTLQQAFTILPDPRLETTEEEFAAQETLLHSIHNAVTDAHDAVNTIRSIRTQIDSTLKRAKRADMHESLQEAADTLKDTLQAIEETIIQTKSKSPQDPLNYPIRINDKLASLFYSVEGDFGPTRQSQSVFDHLSSQLTEQLERLELVLEEDVPAFNELVAAEKVPAIVVED